MPSPEQLSHLIGRIYDCAIDPKQWPAAMQSICTVCAMHQSTLLMADFKEEDMRFLAEWNVSKDYQQMLLDHFQPLALDLYRQSLAANNDIDSPHTISRHPMGYEAFKQTSMHKLWAKPQGIGDAANILVLRETARIGVFAATKLATLGPLTDAEIGFFRLLAPHLRRAVTISNIMDLKSVEATALAETLDALTVGIVLVAVDGRIVLANKRAEVMLTAGDVIGSNKGRLFASQRKAHAELERAIGNAAKEEAIGAAGIGISMLREAGAPVVAHVLPLMRREFHRDLPRGAAAAIFLTGGASGTRLQIASVAASLGLTEAEGRLLDLLMRGLKLAGAAKSLGVTRTTAKTHLTHIFEKTGLSRQSDLIRLAASLVPPIKTD